MFISSVEAILKLSFRYTFNQLMEIFIYMKSQKFVTSLEENEIKLDNELSNILLFWWPINDDYLLTYIWNHIFIVNNVQNLIGIGMINYNLYAFTTNNYSYQSLSGGSRSWSSMMNAGRIWSTLSMTIMFAFPSSFGWIILLWYWAGMVCSFPPPWPWYGLPSITRHSSRCFPYIWEVEGNSEK